MTTPGTSNAGHAVASTWGREVMRGAVAMGWSAICIHGLSFVRVALLARLLIPELFGIVALAESFLITLRQLQDFNFDTGVLYRQTRLPQTIQANLVLKGIFSGFTLLLIWLVHSWLNRWYDPRVGTVLLWFAAGAVVQTLGGTPRVLLERDFRFTEMACVQVASAVIRTVVPVVLALAGFGLMSLVAASLIDMLLPALGFWWRRPIHLEASPSREDFRWFFQFSWPLWMAGGLSIICYAGSHVIVGSVLGNTMLGLYALAFTLARLPVQLITHAISRATFPAYAKFQGDPVTVTRLYQLVMSLLCWFVFPLATLAAVLAPEAIRWGLGEPWVGAVPLFQSLCLFTALLSIQEYAIGFFNAHGRTVWFRNLMTWETIVLFVFASGLILRHGALGMVWAINGMLLCGVPYALFYVRRLIGIVPLWPLARLPLLISVLMGGATLLLQEGIATWPVPARLVVKAAAGLLVGGSTGWALGRARLTVLRQGLQSLWRGEWHVMT